MSYQQPYGYPALPAQTQILVQPYRCSTAHVVVAWICAVLTGLYLLPWAVSATRNRTNVGATALVNLFLGWTLVGWVVALVMACGSERPVVVVHHTYAGPPPQQHWVQQQPMQPPQPPQPSQPPWAQLPAQPALPASPTAPVHPAYAAEPTMVDPLGNEPTRPLPRSPWEPDHRR